MIDIAARDWLGLRPTAALPRAAITGLSGKWLVGRKGNDRRANTGYFHHLGPGGSKRRDQIASLRNGAQAPAVRGRNDNAVIVRTPGSALGAARGQVP